MTEEAKLLNAWYHAKCDEGEAWIARYIVTPFIDHNEHLSLVFKKKRKMCSQGLLNLCVIFVCFLSFSIAAKPDNFSLLHKLHFLATFVDPLSST